MNRSRCSRQGLPPVADAAEHGRVHGRNRRVPGGVELRQPFEEPHLVEPRSAHDRSARLERGEQAGDQSVDVEERHHVQASVLGAEAKGRCDVACRATQRPFVNGTSFGREVVPEVWSKSAMSSLSGCRGTGAAA